jgi:hypothetical protein
MAAMFKIALIPGGGNVQTDINISAHRATNDLRTLFSASSNIQLVEWKDADIIVFVSPLSLSGADVIFHEAYRGRREKCVVFDQSDSSLALLPGLYTNVPAFRLDKPYIRFAHYLRPLRNPYLEGSDPAKEHLFSFVGSRATCPRVRDKVLALQHPRAVLTETSNATCKMDQEFAEVMKRSKFVICPRGICGSSMRVFEAMRSACVPVIISDRWRSVGDIDWSSFSLQVPEKKISQIPEMLEGLEWNAEEMGSQARLVFEENFSAKGTPGFLIKEFQFVMATKGKEKVNSFLALRTAVRNFLTAPLVMSSEYRVCCQQLKSALRLFIMK